MTIIDPMRFDAYDIKRLKSMVTRYLHVQQAYDSFVQNPDTDPNRFKSKFVSFYGLGRGVLTNDEQNAFFHKLLSLSGDESVPAIMDSLHETFTREFNNTKYYLSFSSKMLHTINHQTPIYDSHVRSFLSKNEDVRFLRLNQTNSRQTYLTNWQALTDWYTNNVRREDMQNHITWFRREISSSTLLSDVKVLVRKSVRERQVHGVLEPPLR